MQITTTQLASYLKKNLPRVLVVYGEEAFLQIEACQKIKRAAYERGYKERKLMFADQGFNWDEVELATSNLSLFSSQQLLDIRIPTGKPGAVGAKALQKLGDSDLTNVIVLISIPSFDRQIKNSKWFDHLDRKSLMIHAQRIGKLELPKWIHQKLKSQNQQANIETIDFIIDKVEGNLMAASQEIQKLSLLLPQGPLNLKLVEEALRDVSRHDISDIGVALLTKNRHKFVKVMRGLEFEGTSPPLILWAITQEIRTIFSVMTKVNMGVTVAEALRISRCWGFRKQTIPSIVTTLNRPEITQMMKDCHEVDLVIKGLSKKNPWDSLINLGLHIIDVLDKKSLSSAA